jgi:hypothetical protein
VWGQEANRSGSVREAAYSADGADGDIDLKAAPRSRRLLGLPSTASADGEDAMMLAEKNWDSPRLEVVGITPTLQELRARLSKALAELG